MPNNPSLASSLIDPTLQKTKRFLFPISSTWWTLGFVSLFTRMRASSSFGNLGRAANSDVFSLVKPRVGFFLFGLGIFSIFGLFFQWVSSLFTFIFLENVVTQKAIVRPLLKKYRDLGTSLFLWTLLFFMILLLALILPGLPLILAFLRMTSDFSLAKLGVSVFFLVLYVFYALVLLVLYAILDFVIYNFTVVEMHRTRKSFWPSFVFSLRLVRNRMREVGFYLLFRFLLGLVCAIILFMLLIPVLFVFVLVGLFLFAIFYVLWLLLPWLLVFLVVLGLLVGLVLLCLLIYALALVSLPVNVFFTQYAYSFYMALATSSDQKRSLVRKKRKRRSSL